MIELVSHVTHYQNLSNSKFIIKPKLFHDELLSSWLIRSAYSHLTAPTSFTNMHFPEYSKNIIWQRDLDIWAPSNLLKRLSFKSGITNDLLLHSTLRSFEGLLTEGIGKKAYSPFISPLGNYGHVKKLGGVKFCPLCWIGDPVPYIRKNWRLSFYNACVFHNILMHNSCPQCTTPITISKTYQGLSFTNCFKCGYDLKQCDNVKVDPTSSGLIAIKNILEVISTNFYLFDGAKIPALDFFCGLRQLKKIIYLWRYKKGTILDPNINEERFVHETHVIKTPFYESYISISELFLLYASCIEVLSSSNRVKYFIQENHIRSYEITKDNTNIFWSSNLKT